MKSTSRHPNAVDCLALVAVGIWPVWGWAIRRLFDGSDEPWGIVPLAILSLAVGRRIRQGASLVRGQGVADGNPLAGDATWTLVAVLAYCLIYPSSTPLIRAVFGMSALSVPLARILRGRRFDVAIWGLAMLSLPTMASLQFYGGYPMRVLVARGAALVLRLGGSEVRAAGAALRWGDWFVDVDAPCSGVKALWTGALLVCLLAFVGNLRWSRVLPLSAAALGIILTGNVLRAAALFHLEVGHLPFSTPWLHSGVGLVVFGGVAVAIVGLGWRMPAGERPSAASAEVDTVAHCGRGGGAPPRGISTTPRPRRRQVVAMAGLGAACAVAAILPACSPERRPIPAVGVDWPTVFENQPLRPVDSQIPSGPAFPGAVAQFSDGTRRILLKSVSRPSRLIHPAADCYRGSGWKVSPLPTKVDGVGRHWSVFTASRGDAVVTVREIVTDRAGNHWSTISAWYWSATLKRTHPPWQVAVVVENAEDPSSRRPPTPAGKFAH